MFTHLQLAAAYENYKGPVVVAKMAKPRLAEKTFRNNKYSVFNRGRLGSNFGRGGTFIFTDKIA
jgi:hypothetical protein